MASIDPELDWKRLYRPSPKNFDVLDVPPMAFLMVDGRGDPNTSTEYAQALEALYAVTFTLKFTSKKNELDLPIYPLEGLWTDKGTGFSLKERSTWNWTMMIRMPEWIVGEDVQQAVEKVRQKRALPLLSSLRLEMYYEGLSVQIMHIGPYSAEGSVLEALHGTFLPTRGYVPNGKHHEIYLSNPQRTAVGRLKTILRQPVKEARSRMPEVREPSRDPFADSLIR